jgi:hypothetical protein
MEPIVVMTAHHTTDDGDLDAITLLTWALSPAPLSSLISSTTRLGERKERKEGKEGKQGET